MKDNKIKSLDIFRKFFTKIRYESILNILDISNYIMNQGKYKSTLICHKEFEQFL